MKYPGSFLGRDMDEEEGSYYNKQFVAEGSTLKNDYKANPDVKVRINGNGVIGNTSKGDFYTYTLNCTVEGDYEIEASVIGSANSEKEIKFTFHSATEQTTSAKFTGKGWGDGNTMDVKAEEKVHLEPGIHTMKVELPLTGGIDLKQFKVDNPITGIDEIYNDKNVETDVYSIDGRYLRKATNITEALNGLASGVYITGNKKVVKM